MELPSFVELAQILCYFENIKNLIMFAQKY